MIANAARQPRMTPLRTGFSTVRNARHRSSFHPLSRLVGSLGNRGRQGLVQRFADQITRGSSGVQRAPGDKSACPEVVSLTATIKDPAISDACHKGVCRLETGCCSTPRGCGSSKTSGSTIPAQVKAPEGCSGELAFMQNVLKTARRRTSSDGTKECIDATEPHLDGGYPWKECTVAVTGKGEYSITTDDCPNIGLEDGMSAGSAAETFKTFLTWQPEGKKGRTPIANVTWGWSGATTRTKGTDCASSWTKPTGSHTEGKGGASSDTPVTKPKIQEVKWAKCK